MTPEQLAAWTELKESFKTLEFMMEGRMPTSLPRPTNAERLIHAKALFADLVHLIGMFDPTWTIRENTSRISIYKGGDE